MSGFTLGIISQRLLKFDQDAIRNSVEAAGDDVLRELPGLTPGQAVVSGDAMNTPALTQVRERLTEHGADSIPATSQWTNAHRERAERPTRPENADMSGGDSTGSQDLV